MKLRTLLLLLLFSARVFSQTEFGDTDNGLIYSSNTVHQLQRIVDSLNIKFRVCELNKTYYSKLQTRAHFIYLRSNQAKEAKMDLLAGITYSDFIAKYPDASTDKDLLLVKFQYKDYEGDDALEYYSQGLKSGDSRSIYIKKDSAEFKNPSRGKWVFDYWKGSEYTPTSISAFYLLDDFTSQPIPAPFARLILYSDCMVDTTVDVFYDKASRHEPQDWLNSTIAERKQVNLFMSYVDSVTHLPAYPTKNDQQKEDAYNEEIKIWEQLKKERIDSARKTGRRFDKLLQAAIKEARASGNSDDEFEDYVATYSSKKMALELKRNRIVVGRCSRDDSPRFHAFNIALLAAETVNWEIFLRCHLDIMNDRFDRRAESDIARAGRETYLRELEVLDIDVVNLLLGISLRFENASNKHYYGSIDRLGRALAESKDADLVEAVMLDMITSCELDDYNRVLIYYLFRNYNYYLKDEARHLINKKKLAMAVNSLPLYLVSKGIEE